MSLYNWHVSQIQTTSGISHFGSGSTIWSSKQLHYCNLLLNYNYNKNNYIYIQANFNSHVSDMLCFYVQIWQGTNYLTNSGKSTLYSYFGLVWITCKDIYELLRESFESFDRFWQTSIHDTSYTSIKLYNFIPLNWF